MVEERHIKYGSREEAKNWKEYFSQQNSKRATPEETS